MRSSMDSGSLDHKHWLTSNITVAGHLVRTELTDARVPAVTGSSTVIVDDSLHTMTILFDRSRTATVRTLPSTPRLGRANDSTSRFIVAPRMTMRDLGAGESMLGHPTHKYSVSTSYVAQTTLLGSPCRKTVNTVETIWVATDMQREEKLRAYVRDSRSLTSVELGPVGDSLERLRLHRERLISGFVLRSETALTKPSAGGATSKITRSIVVLALSRGPIPRSLFAVPADYRIMPEPSLRPKTAADSAVMKRAQAKAESTMNARSRSSVCDP